MEEKEVRIPILGVIDENELECREDLRFFETYPNGKGVYLMKNTGISIALRNVYKSSEKNKDGKEFALWTDFPIPMNIVIEDIKKEQETQLKELKESVEHLNDELYDKIVKIETIVTNSNNAVSFLCDSLNSLQDDSHVITTPINRENHQQLTGTHAQLTENGSASNNGISE